MHLLAVYQSSCWTNCNASTGRLAVFLLNGLKCTYWQSVRLLVEQTEIHVLAVCQSSCWIDWNASTGSLAVFLLNELKCVYWHSASILVEQTEMRLLALCQYSCWTDWNARNVDLVPHFMRYRERDHRHTQDYRSFLYKELIFCIIRYIFSLIPSFLSKYIVTSLGGFYPCTGLWNKCSTLTGQIFQRLKWRSGAIHLTR